MPHIVEVSDMFWDVVEQLGSGTGPHCPLLAELQAHTVGMHPMLTDEAIALPPGFWGPHPTEFVYDSLGALFDAVLRMYEAAAALLPESPLQRLRRVRLRAAARRVADAEACTFTVSVTY